MKKNSEQFEFFVSEFKAKCKYPMNSYGWKMLRQALEENNNGMISDSTLKRIFGESKITESVNDSTLDILAKFIGYENVYDCIEKLKKRKNKYYSHSMEVGKMSLTDAMIKVLEDSDEECLNQDEIAKKINEAGLYEKSNGSLLMGSQVVMRAENYPSIFEMTENGIRLAKNYKKNK